MECKRVLSERRIIERLKEGVKQLKKSVNPSASDIGIVAISLSKLVNPGDRYIVSDSAHKDLSDGLRDLLRANEPILGRMHTPHVAGFLFYVSSAAYVPGKGYAPVRAGTFFPSDLAEQPYLRKLASALAV